MQQQVWQQRTDRADGNVYRVNTVQHLLAVENGVVLLGLEQNVQDLSLPARRSTCNHKHDSHGGTVNDSQGTKNPTNWATKLQ